MILDHVARALSNLESQFDKSVNLRAIIRAAAREIQAVEEAIYSLASERYLSTAAGAALDQYGRVVGAQRNGLTDTVYRRVIRAKIRANMSSGTVEDILGIYVEMTGDNSATVEESPPNTLLFSTLTSGALDPVIETTLKKYLNASKKAGIRLLIIQAPEDYFGFFDNPDALGFETGEFAGVINYGD